MWFLFLFFIRVFTFVAWAKNSMVVFQCVFILVAVIWGLNSEVNL